MDVSDPTALKLQAHEEICALRYSNIEEKLGDVKNTVALINKVLLTVAGTLGLQMLLALGYFVASGIK